MLGEPDVALTYENVILGFAKVNTPNYDLS